MKKTNQQTEMENPLYHDTWMLLRKYRDVVWSLELSVQQVRRQFQIEFGSSIEDFLESIYLAGVVFADTGIQEHARSIERSYKMLKLIENAVNLLTTGYCTTPTFPRSSTKTQRRSSSCFSRIFRILVTAPTFASEKKRLNRFRQSFGAILPETA